MSFSTQRTQKVLVDDEELGEGQAAPLAWFGAQKPPLPLPFQDPTLPRVFLRTPSSSSSTIADETAKDSEAGITAAGIGAAHILTGAGRLEDGAWEEASLACPGMRYDVSRGRERGGGGRERVELSSKAKDICLFVFNAEEGS